MNVAILIICTNSYLPLGLRLTNRFHHFYIGKSNIKFYLVSDKDPIPYLNKNINASWIKNTHTSWVDATNSKFSNILKLSNEPLDYIYYMDADTNIHNKFDDSFMLGEVVGAEHFGNQDWMSDVKNFDRNPQSKAYVPFDTKLDQVYYHGAFFGGEKQKIINICRQLKINQEQDRLIHYEPAVNDESYINNYFHYNKPSKTILFTDFPFQVSDRAGIESNRDVNFDVQYLLDDIQKHKNDLWDIKKGLVIN